MSIGKAFIRKWPKKDGSGHVTMVLMLTDGLDNLDDETLYAFNITEIDDSVLLTTMGKRQTDEFKGHNASGIVTRL